MTAFSFLHSFFCQAIKDVTLKPRSTSVLANCRPDVISAVLASVSAPFISLISAWQGQTKSAHGCVPVGAAHSRLQLLHTVHRVCENDGMCDLCVMLEG